MSYTEIRNFVMYHVNIALQNSLKTFENYKQSIKITKNNIDNYFCVNLSDDAEPIIYNIIKNNTYNKSTYALLYFLASN